MQKSDDDQVQAETPRSRLSAAISRLGALIDRISTRDLLFTFSIIALNILFYMDLESRQETDELTAKVIVAMGSEFQYNLRSARLESKLENLDIAIRLGFAGQPETTPLSADLLSKNGLHLTTLFENGLHPWGGPIEIKGTIGSPSLILKQVPSRACPNLLGPENAKKICNKSGYNDITVSLIDRKRT